MDIHESLALEREGIISIVGAGGKTSLMYALARELRASGKRVLTTTTTKIYPPTREESAATLISRDPEELVERARPLLRTYSHLTVASRYLEEHGKLEGLEPSAIEYISHSNLFDFIVIEADGAARRSLKACAPHEPVVPLFSDRVVAVVGLDVVGKPLSEESVFRSDIFSRIAGLKISEAITESAIASVITRDMSAVAVSSRGCMKIAFLNKADTLGSFQAGLRITAQLETSARAVFNRIVIGALGENPLVYRCTTL